MKDVIFLSFQAFLIRNYARIQLLFKTNKTEDEIELEFIEKYSPMLRKVNNNIEKFKNYLINNFKN
jgi:hypothetical protein